MKIRKVEEKPMVLHTRKKPTLHIQKKKKPAGNDKPNPIFRCEEKAERIKRKSRFFCKGS